MWVATMRAWMIFHVVCLYIQTLHATVLPLVVTTKIIFTSDDKTIACYTDEGLTLNDVTSARAVVVEEDPDDTEPNTWDTTSTDITDKCITFVGKPTHTGSIAFVLKLLEGASVEMANSVLKFDIQDIGSCDTAYILGSKGNIIRLYCTSLPDEYQTANSITLDDEVVDVEPSPYQANVVYYFVATEKIEKDVIFTICTGVNAVINEEDGSVQGCSSIATDLQETVATLNGLALEYANPDDTTTYTQVAVQTSSPLGTDVAEVVFYWTTHTPPLRHITACKEPITLSLGSCSIDYTKAFREMNIIYSEYTQRSTMKSAVDYPFTDYNLGAAGITKNTAEISWTTKVGTLTFLATLIPTNDPSSAPYIATDVTCNEAPLFCLAYFIELPADNYKVKIQETPSIIDTSIPNLLNTVQSEPFNMPPDQMNDLYTGMRVNHTHLWWEPNDSTIKVSICIEVPSLDMNTLEEYQLELVDQQGHQLRVHEASQITGNYVCFSDITIDTRIFNVTDRVTVVATKRDIGSQTIMLSGHAEVFLIIPEIDEVERESGRLSWTNPGGYTFTLRKSHSSIPLVTNLTCHTCNYYYTINTEGHDDRLVVETEDSKVYITAEIPVPYGAHTLDN